MRYGFVKSYEDVVFCLDDQKLYLACVISGLVFKHHVFSIEGKALLIALTYSLVKGTTFSKMRNTITSGSSNQTPTDVSSPSNTSSSAKTKEDTRRPSCKPPSMTPWVGFAKRSKLHR